MDGESGYTRRSIAGVHRAYKLYWAVIACILAGSCALVLYHEGQKAGMWDIATHPRGDITYSVDRRLGLAGVAGAHDAFKAWDAANPDITLTVSDTWEHADVRVARMDAFCTGMTLSYGCACIGLSPLCPDVENLLRWGDLECHVPSGATIGVSRGLHARDGTPVMFTRDQMRDLVAHEFGHNLGLRHSSGDETHLMYGQYDPIPYSDHGYVVPDEIAGGAARIIHDLPIEPHVLLESHCLQ